jgi:hypothetical protein
LGPLERANLNHFISGKGGGERESETYSVGSIRKS